MHTKIVVVPYNPLWPQMYEQESMLILQALGTNCISLRTHQVHVFEEGDPEVERYLKFRDWMRSHEEDALAYANLKIELAARFPQDILQYCN